MSRWNSPPFHFTLLVFLTSITEYTSSMSALTRIATFRLSPTTNLCIVRGSVTDFCWNTPTKAAIVNAANEACLGGGGVDGAITSAGGPNLHHDRMKLPLSNGGVRCPTGHAKLTGPNDYGSLNVNFVIHAVGPRYFDCESHAEGDKLLRSAYMASLDRAQEASLEAIAFSLLSAGIFRGDRTLKEVLSIAVQTICDWLEDHDNDYSLQSVFMCGFTPHEVNMLVDIAEDDMKLKIVEDSDTSSEDENMYVDERPGDSGDSDSDPEADDTCADDHDGDDESSK